MENKSFRFRVEGTCSISPARAGMTLGGGGYLATGTR